MNIDFYGFLCPRPLQWIQSYKFSTLNRQVFTSVFSVSLSLSSWMCFNTICILFLIVSQNLQYMELWRLPIVLHFISSQCENAETNFWIDKSLSVGKKSLSWILYSAPLMPMKRWCVSFTIDTLVLFRFYWQVFLFAYLSHSCAIRKLVRDRLHSLYTFISPLLVSFIFFA